MTILRRYPTRQKFPGSAHAACVNGRAGLFWSAKAVRDGMKDWAAIGGCVAEHVLYIFVARQIFALASGKRATALYYQSTYVYDCGPATMSILPPRIAVPAIHLAASACHGPAHYDNLGKVSASRQDRADATDNVTTNARSQIAKFRILDNTYVRNDGR
jgi:hypothetical protein